MKNVYLIQRAKFGSNPESTGIDKLLDFDYMGSAEFEFGALPQSLKRVRANIKEYIQFQYSFLKHPDKVVTVLCRKDQYDFIGDILEKLSENKLFLKERCDLSDFIKGKTKYANDFWWDIDNDWFFWKYDLNSNFDVEFKETLSFPAYN